MADMGAAGFRDALQRLGMTQTSFAKLVHVNPRTVRRWALGESKVPVVVALLLEAMAQT